MEQTYWLGRRGASAANARKATSAEARLVHFDLAGRYSVLAAVAQSKSAQEEGESAHYLRLETGARWLAERAAGAEERIEHLTHAERYARLRLEAPAEGR